MRGAALAGAVIVAESAALKDAVPDAADDTLIDERAVDEGKAVDEAAGVVDAEGKALKDTLPDATGVGLAEAAGVESRCWRGTRPDAGQRTTTASCSMSAWRKLKAPAVSVAEDDKDVAALKVVVPVAAIVGLSVAVEVVDVEAVGLSWSRGRGWWRQARGHDGSQR
jgi:hypothetical protein